jgi:hypothetical protein
VQNDLPEEASNSNDPYCLADNNHANCASLQGWNGPYLTWTKDPWGSSYKVCGGGTVEHKAHSIGPNQIDNWCTGDDVCVNIIPDGS